MKEIRITGACIDGLMITSKAVIIAQNLDLYDFKGSKGWLCNFLRRNRFVLRYVTPKINFKLITSAHFKRRITTTGRKRPEDSAEIIEDFFATCNQ